MTATTTARGDEAVSATPATEGRCQKCGGRNVSAWFVDSDRYNLAVEALGISRGLIICPGCFEAGHMLATGMKAAWELRPHTPFTWVDREDPHENECWKEAQAAATSTPEAPRPGAEVRSTEPERQGEAPGDQREGLEGRRPVESGGADR